MPTWLLIFKIGVAIPLLSIERILTRIAHGKAKFKLSINDLH
jgi:hypothetical protein